MDHSPFEHGAVIFWSFLRFCAQIHHGAFDCFLLEEFFGLCTQMDRGPCARPQISFVAPIVLLNGPTFSHNGDFCKLRVVNSRCIVSCGNYYPMQCAASQVPECFGTSQRVRFRVCQPKNEQVLRNWKKRARAKRAYVCALLVCCV